jgi:uncharacterized protein
VPTVSGLAITPVKATRLHTVDRVTVSHQGVRENRRFYLIDEHDRMINSKIAGELQTVVADYSDVERSLRLTFPDGRILEQEIRLAEPIATRFYSGDKVARLVEGPWSAALSAHAGRALRLVEADPDGGVDRGVEGSLSLISRASLARMARAAGEESIDVRRFRMLIEIDGVDAHAEDRWVGGTVSIGETRVAFGGHVGRCLITSRHPDTGEVDLPTLDILRDYRGHADTTEPLAFGIWGRVLEPGTIRVGDLVTPLGSVPER